MVYLSHAISDNRLEQESDHNGERVFSSTVYGTRWAIESIPRYELPKEEMPPNVAYELIRSELATDGNPVLNLATFITTFMEKEAEKLIRENLPKNFVDYEEYPATVELQNRCVNIIARLFNAPVDDPSSESMGVSTIGSSEAIILSVLAMKKLWQKRRIAEGKSTEHPNLVMSSSVQVCVEKATRYLEIEEKFVYLTEGRYVLDPQKAVDLVDENTIGVCVILGSTYTGHYEDVKAVNDLLIAKNEENGWDVPIHVDAASGGFVAPFINPGLVWDFRLPLVRSINVSGHKYGLCYPGVGWVIWKSPKYLPEELIFNVNYLGNNQATFTLNFSKSATPIISQYYMLIRLGRSGYTAVMENLMEIANILADRLEKTGKFEILSDRRGNSLPLVAFRLSLKDIHYDEFDVAQRLRDHGWIVPAYNMAPRIEHIKLLRIVLREDFSRSRCDTLVRDIMTTLNHLDELDKHTLHKKRDLEKRIRHLKHVSRAGFPGKIDESRKKTDGIC